jgi:hypothetical protein
VKNVVIGYALNVPSKAIYVQNVALNPNGLHKTSKGLREMNYQDTTQFERAMMLKLPI